ncbi:MAG: DNA adenine methylase [Desulfomonilaceae bacterium]
MRSPIVWFGGKGQMVKKLLALLPRHHIYVEAFGGGASLLFAKEPSRVEVYNDLDSGLVNFFRVLRDPQKFARFYHLAVLTPWSREEYDYCRKTWQDVEDEVERAYRWFVVARMSFSGNFGRSWSACVTHSHNGMASTTSKWLSILREMPMIHERIMRVQIEHQDFRQLIPHYDTENTLFYLDPPYVPETRKDGGYSCEMSLVDHAEMVDVLLGIKGMAILSGYAHPVYNKLEQNGWQRIDYSTSCHAVGRTRQTGVIGPGSAAKKSPRVESVWLNPAAVAVKSGSQMTIEEVAVADGEGEAR